MFLVARRAGAIAACPIDRRQGWRSLVRGCIQLV